jgi:hypothetical protein
MNRTVRPVSFAFEADVVSVFANIMFGAAGAPSFATGSTAQSTSVPENKGLCNIALNSISFTATTDGSTAVLTSVSSFAGLYVGMSVTGTGIAANSVISSMNPGADTITLSHATTAAGTVTLTASGGQYVLTFGSQYTPFKRLDTYVRLLSVAALWDEAPLQGGASTAASSPAAPAFFLVGNAVSTAGSASITFQLGYYTGAAFTAANPASGEKLKLGIQLTRSSAV